MIARFTLLTALLLTQAPEKPKEEFTLPDQMAVGFTDMDAVKAKVIICIRVKQTEIVCMSFEKFLEERKKQGQPITFPEPKKQVEL